MPYPVVGTQLFANLNANLNTHDQDSETLRPIHRHRFYAEVMNLKSRITIATATVALATLGLAACSSAGDTSTETGTETGTTTQTTNNEVVGSWGDPGVKDKPSLEFNADGTVSGSDGCNQLTGSWTEDGGVISFGPLASTKMACEGATPWLVDPASATVKGDVLTVSNSDGKEIGTLNRG